MRIEGERESCFPVLPWRACRRGRAGGSSETSRSRPRPRATCCSTRACNAKLSAGDLYLMSCNHLQNSAKRRALGCVIPHHGRRKRNRFHATSGKLIRLALYWVFEWIKSQVAWIGCFCCWAERHTNHSKTLYMHVVSKRAVFGGGGKLPLGVGFREGRALIRKRPPRMPHTSIPNFSSKMQIFIPAESVCGKTQEKRSKSRQMSELGANRIINCPLLSFPFRGGRHDPLSLAHPLLMRNARLVRRKLEV